MVGYNLPACRQAANTTYAAFREITYWIRLGIRERQLAWRMGRILEDHGSEKLAFPVIVAFGENAAQPHHVPTARALCIGDMIKIDAGGVVKSMRGDVTRTYFFGKPTQKFIKRYQAVYTAQHKALSHFKPGNTGQHIDAVARNYLQSQRLGKLFMHSLGHGVGRAIHQAPWITPGKRGKNSLKIGQIVTNEPGIYEKGWGGIRIEDMLEITAKGATLLGEASSKLSDIILPSIKI